MPACFGGVVILAGIYSISVAARYQFLVLILVLILVLGIILSFLIPFLYCIYPHTYFIALPLLHYTILDYTILDFT